MISYLLVTRDRPRELRRTLAELGSLEPHAAEVIVVDNGSNPPAVVPDRLDNGLPVLLTRLGENRGAAGRNAGAAAASGDWLVMLDDDSHPLSAVTAEWLAAIPHDVAAVGAEIVLAGGRREAGGLPEVIVGCGAAVRRDVFVTLGGYDPAFGYYAEEYDLCARLLLAGHRVIHDRSFRVLHRKTATGRDFDLILSRLVRNGGWVIARYAPRCRRDAELATMIERYEAIGRREGATSGFEQGRRELLATLDDQPDRVMSPDLHDRFTGVAHVRAGLVAHGEPPARVTLVEIGRGVETIRQVLTESGVVVDHSHETRMVGTLSPGPVLDALDRWSWLNPPVRSVWAPGHTVPSGDLCNAAAAI